MIESMNARRKADGTVTADHFPEEIMISVELLADADPEFMRVEAGGLYVVILGVPYVAVSMERSKDVHGIPLTVTYRRGRYSRR